MKPLRSLVAVIAVLSTWQAQAQTTKRLTTVTASQTSAPQIVNGNLDITRFPFIVDYAYKKIDHLTATVCAAGVTASRKDKHATLFLNLGAAHCDPYKAATVFTTINKVKDANDYAASFVGKTFQFKDAFFKRDNDRDRFVSYVELAKVAALEGKDYTALPNLRADLVRTDMPKAQAKPASQNNREQATSTPAQMTNANDRATATPQGGAQRTTATTRNQNMFQRFLNFFK